MVNDDKPLIRVTEEESIIFGTPWNGKHHLSRNIAVPLQAVCILERSDTNHIEKITKTEAFPVLLGQMYRPRNVDAFVRSLQLLNRMDVGLYRLGCNMDISAAELSYGFMHEDAAFRENAEKQ